MQYKKEFLAEGNLKKKLLTVSVATVLLLTTLSIVFIGTVSSADYDNPATMFIVPSATDVDVGDIFNVTVFLNSSSQNVSWFNVSLFTYNESTLWMTNVTDSVWFPTWNTSNQATVNNITGNITNINASTGSSISGNNTAFIVNFTAQACGTLFLNMSGVSAQNESDLFNMTWNNETIIIHPSVPSAFNAETINATMINLTFNKGFGADNTTIVYKNNLPPSNFSDGIPLCNTSADYFVHTGLNPQTTVHYMAASWNETEGLYSLQTPITSNTTTDVNITIQGQVKDAQNNTPIQGATVMIFIEDDGKGLDNNMWQTDGNGNFTTQPKVNGNSTPGRYTVEVTYEGYIGYVNWNIQLSEGETVNLSIFLEPYFDPANYSILRGNVTAAGEPLVDVEIIMLDTNLTHMIMGGEGEEGFEKSTFTDENGNFSFNITYNSTYILLTFDYGYYASFSNEIMVGSNETKWYSFTLQPAPPDTIDMTVQFTDLDDATVTVNRTVIAVSPIFRFGLDFDPEIGNSNQNVSQTEVESYMQLLGRYGPTFGFLWEDKGKEPEKGDEEMHGPSFLAITAILQMDGSNLTEFVPGSHNGNLDNLVNTSVTSNETIYYNATFNITLDGPILNVTNHSFNITTVFNSTVVSNITFVFGNFYNITNVQNNTNGIISNTTSNLTMAPGNGSIDAFAYANITLALNGSTISLPIIEIPTWHIADKWVFNETENGTTDETKYSVDGKPLKPWERHRYRIGDENLSYLSYEMRKETIGGPEMLFVTIGDLDWLDIAGDKSINYLVNDIDFPIYSGKSWSTISWWGQQVNATVISCSDSKLTGNGTFSCVKINYTNATSDVVGQEWYSPNVKFFVNRTQIVDGSQNISSNLTSYSHAPFIGSIDIDSIDSDSDGLINHIYANVTINASRFYENPTDYVIEGPFFKDSNWGPPTDIMWVFEEEELRDLSTGIKYVNLTYSGSLINASGVDGPYTGNLELCESGEWGPGQMIDFASFEVNYSHTDFQSPAVKIISIEDFGNDTDSDGKYNYLTVNVTVNASEAGSYSIHCGLDKVIQYGGWDEWRWITGTGTPPMNLGENEVRTIAVNFNGEEIYEKGYNGPYKLHLEIVNTTTNSQVARNETDTSMYYYEQFETPSVYFNKSTFNQSGMHDYINSSGFLTINTSIIVETADGAGSYELCGGLHYSANDTKDWGDFITGNCQYVTLELGTNIIPLNFNLGEIYEKLMQDNYNGSFKAGIGLSERVGDWIGPEIDWTNYFTKNYSYTDLPEPPITMEIFNDEITGGGDNLKISAYVNITSDEFANKTYDLHGGVHWVDNSQGWDDWRFITGMGKEVYLGHGQNTVSLNFSGMEISASGEDGPYMIWMGLDSIPNHEMIINDEYETASYNADNFSTPAVQFVQQNTTAEINGTEYFTVNVSLNVSQAGDYHIGGGVHWVENMGDWENWVFITGTGKEYHLTENTNISINFDQGMIRNGLPLDYNGILKINIGIENVSDWQHIAHLEYDTPQSYSPSDFSAAAVVINSTTYGINSDGDLFANITYYAINTDNYDVHGGLHDSNWWFITGTWNPDLTLNSGENTVNVTFSGNDIFNSMQNGPYNVWIGIETTSSHRLVASTEFEITEYSYTDFEAASSGVRIIRELMTDGTVDYMNTTGTKSYLTVNVSFNVSSNGTYWLDGGLNYVSGNNWQFISGTGSQVTLSLGTTTVPLNFNAGDIYSSGHSGKYKVWIGLRNMSTWMDIDHYEYTTRWYSSSNAPPPPIQFLPMTEGDTACGYINGDYLTINVTLNVSDSSYSGTYDLHGGIHYLTSEGWWQHITGTGTWIDIIEGENTKTLNFTAGEIKAGLPDGYNDNLSIWIGLNDIDSWDEITHTEYITKVYQKSDFPGAKVNVTANNDSVWGSNFTVNLTINISTGYAGNYDVHGGVHWIDNSRGWDEWRFITGTGSKRNLADGENNISLNFSAGDIYTALDDQGYTGKLTAWIEIQNITTWAEVAHTEYETDTTYSKDDFNPPSLTLNCTGDFYNTANDFLQVNVSINGTSELLAQNNDYEIHAGIHWKQGWEWRFITGFYTTLTLSSNITIPLNFSGTAISASEQTGPFEVWVGISEIGQWRDIAHDEYTTTDYSQTEFAEPAVRIINNDTVPNDFANGTDYLTINVTVNASQTGEYFLEGCLHWKEGDQWNWMAWAGEEINITSTGEQIISLDFDGKQLANAENDGWNGGTLVAWLAVMNKTTWREISRVDEYETGSYSPSDFSATPITFNHSVFINDTRFNSSGGEVPYTHLNVTVQLNVTMPGDNYVVHAGLFDVVNKTIIVTASSNITNGSNSVSISFNGSKIYKKQYNGTFEFKAKLFDTTGGKWFECDKINNITDSYNYTDFVEGTPEARIVGSYSNFTDANGNLVINVTVNVTQSGTQYELYGDLFDNSSSTYVTNAKNVTYFNNQTNDVVAQLVFNGSAIENSTASAPYTLTYLRLSIYYSVEEVWEELEVEVDPYADINPSGGG